MKIYETYVDTLYYQWEKTNTEGSFIDGGCEIEINKKDRREKTHSKQCKDKEVNDTWSRDIRTFYEKSGTISGTKTYSQKRGKS